MSIPLTHRIPEANAQFKPAFGIPLLHFVSGDISQLRLHLGPIQTEHADGSSTYYGLVTSKQPSSFLDMQTSPVHNVIGMAMLRHFPNQDQYLMVHRMSVAPEEIPLPNGTDYLIVPTKTKGSRAFVNFWVADDLYKKLDPKVLGFDPHQSYLGLSLRGPFIDGVDTLVEPVRLNDVTDRLMNTEAGRALIQGAKYLPTPQ